MRRSIDLFGTLLLFGAIAVAQDGAYSRQEMFLGYTFLRANSATNVPAFSANGGGGQYVLNFNSWFGAVGDVYAAHNGNVFGGFTDPVTGIHYAGSKIDNTNIFYQFGPRLTMRKSRFSLFGQMLLGAVGAHASIPITLQSPVTVPTPLIHNPNSQTISNVLSFTDVRLKTEQTSFAYLLGGGLDMKLSKHMTFRPIGIDLQYTRLQNIRDLEDRSQYNLRYQTGFNFTFGGPQ